MGQSTHDRVSTRDGTNSMLLVANLFGFDREGPVRSAAKSVIGCGTVAALSDAKARYVDAEPLYRRALEIGEANLGPHDPRVAIRLDNLAQSRWQSNSSGISAPAGP